MRSIALIGAGNHGVAAVLPAILRLRGRLDLTGVVEPNSDNVNRVRNVAPDVVVHDSVEQLFENNRPEIAYIATLPHLHHSGALAALGAGCHVVCEKPLAPSVAECESLVSAAHGAGLRLVIMFENRYKPHLRCIRDWILSGRIGRVEAMHFQKFWAGPVTEPRRTDLLNATGSLDCGIHTLDLARFFTGGGSWENVHAMGVWFDEPHLLNPPHTAILAQLSGGPLVTFTDSMAYRLKNAIRTGDRSGPASLMIVGTDGVIENVPGGYRLRAGGEIDEFTPSVVSTHSEEIPWVLEDLLTALDTGHSASGFLPDGRDGLLAQQLVEEANRQARATRHT